MSYEKKYLKYKTKYLSLKSQFISKNLMTGGSNDNSFENLDLFSETITSPSIDTNFKLVSLLNNYNSYGGKDPEPVSETRTGSETGTGSVTLAETSVSSDNVASVSSDNAASGTASGTASGIASETVSGIAPEKALQEASVSAAAVSEASVSAAAVSTTNKEASVSATPKEASDLGGGAKKSKVKSHKKYFFDDSDVNLDSTTTDSDLSSLDTDSTDDSDL